MKIENNYDFRERHWEVHKPGLRDSERKPKKDEILLDETWTLGYADDADDLVKFAVNDFQDYLLKSMGLSVRIVNKKAPKVLWVQIGKCVKRGFVIDVKKDSVTLTASDRAMSFRGTVHMEDIMSLEGAPVLPIGKIVREPLYRRRSIHSGCGIDEYPDSELIATVHAGYDAINIMVKDIDVTAAGPRNINDIILRAKKFGIETAIFNYIQTPRHPDEAGVQAVFDKVYGDIFKHYPDANEIGLCGESLHFPSKDPHTSGKNHRESVTDGIPDTRPSPGWYPCYDYPAYIQCIEKAVHKVKPTAEIIFSTYNWGYTPLEVRKKFLENFPKRVTLSVTYEIFSQRKLGKLHTPVMDYTISAVEPGYYFTSECETAHKLGIPIQGNVNTAGIAWDFGCVPFVPVPYRWLGRSLNLRKACKDWGVDAHYATHHYGWWNCITSDIIKWAGWKDFEPDYDELFRKIAVRDYGKKAAPHIMKAWKEWSHAMDYYIASNEDQYGPWRVGSAYPFIFQPNISRTMHGKEIKFPTNPHAHFGYSIIKTFYSPFENSEQSPGFLRYPQELKSLEKMLALWETGLAAARKAVSLAEGYKHDEAERLEALGHFIRNAIITTMNIKRWWLKNMQMQTSPDAKTALKVLAEIRQIALDEIENAKELIPAVECDSRIGWEPSMEYVCDRWHLEWKVRQVESALREIDAYEQMLKLD